MRAKLSAIMPTYNRDKLLPKALNDILQQDFQDFELILINNASADQTQEVCNRYADKDNRIHTFSMEVNKGAANARRFGLTQASADYVMLIDDDDIYEKNYFSHLYGLITKYNADIAVTGRVDVFADGTQENVYIYDKIYELNKCEGISEFLKREIYNTAPPTKLFKKSLFDHIEFKIGSRVDDIHFIYKLFVEAEKTVAQGLPTYRYVRHEDAMTPFIKKNSTITGEVLREYLQMQRERVAYISDRVPECAAQVRYAEWSYMISLTDKVMCGLGKECEQELSYMIRELQEHKKEFMGTIWTTEREKTLMKKYIL